ncbi:MAG: helix-turn-helix domain-containing protein [Clostridia bacterium]|nr:helix-turn-helix domain-containing protein [Clostridia bacterium]
MERVYMTVSQENTKKMRSCENMFPFWNGLTTSLQREIVKKRTIRSFLRQTQLELRDPILKNCLWTVAYGRMDIVMYSAEGRQLSLAQLRQGEGGCRLRGLENARYYVAVVAKEDLGICVIPEELSKRLFANEEVKNYELMSYGRIVEKLVDLSGDMAFSCLRDRLICTLKEYAIDKNTSEIYVTHEELANDLGTSREVVSRILKTLARDGSITLMRKKIVLN